MISSFIRCTAWSHEMMYLDAMESTVYSRALMTAQISAVNMDANQAIKLKLKHHKVYLALPAQNVTSHCLPGFPCSACNNNPQLPGSPCSACNNNPQLPGSPCSACNNNPQLPGSPCSEYNISLFTRLSLLSM